MGIRDNTGGDKDKRTCCSNCYTQMQQLQQQQDMTNYQITMLIGYHVIVVCSNEVFVPLCG